MYIYKIKRFKRKKLLNDRLKGKFFIYDIQNTFHASYDIRTFTFQRDKSTYIYIKKTYPFSLVIQIQRTKREMEIFTIVKSSPLV